MSEQQTEKKPISQEGVNQAIVAQYNKLAEIKNDVRAIKGWVNFFGVIFVISMCLSVIAVFFGALE